MSTIDREFSQAVADAMRSTGCSRTEAVKRVCKADENLHRAYLLGTNSRRVAHLVRERFELEQEARLSRRR